MMTEHKNNQDFSETNDSFYSPYQFDHSGIKGERQYQQVI